ncbi:MAG: hypothetical protein JRH11_23505 [Deltaproteobacteria bacterium]|nr:hypothetical protein [Deltaproteobacteria bacterium]
MARLLGCLLVCPLAACGAGATASGNPPADALVAYVAALESEDAAAVHALLTEELQQELSIDEVRELMADNHDELADQGAEISRGASLVRASADQPLHGGETARLVREEGGWAIDGGVISAPGLGTPMATVLALRRALQRQSLPGVMRVLAREPRAELEAEVTRLLEETEDPLDLEIEVRGNRAKVRTTGGRLINLVREAGEWRIVDIE